MIEKLDIKNGGVEDLLNCIKKINELVDAVNQLVSCEQARTCYELIHKNKTPAENMLTKTLCMDKEFAEEEMERLQKENSDLKDKLEHITDILYESKYALEEIINPSFISHEQEMAQEALDKVNTEIKAITGE